MKKEKWLAYLMLGLASVIFGFSFLFTKQTLARLDVFELLGARFLIASVIMTVLVLTRLVKININKTKLKGLLLISLLQPIAYFVCETFGVKLTSSSESGMMIALMPIAIALFSRAILKETLKPRQWAAVFVSVAGVGLIIGAKGFELGAGSLIGYLLLLVAVAAEGLYSPLVRKTTQTCTPYEITFVMMWAGAVVFNVIGLANAGINRTIGSYFSNVFQTEVILGLLYLGVLSSIVAFFFVNHALSKVNASKSASFANLTTVVSVLAGILIGKEQVLPLQIAGMVLVLISIWGVLYDPDRRRRNGGAKKKARADSHTAQGDGLYPQG